MWFRRFTQISLVVLVAAGAAACAGPLDEPLAEEEQALRLDDEQIAGLPTCVAGMGGRFGNGRIEIHTTWHDDLFAVEHEGELICVGDGHGMSELGLDPFDGLGGDDGDEPPSGEPPPAEGTPLPAKSATEGTPLPARTGSGT